jgi:hypothetical protein
VGKKTKEHTLLHLWNNLFLFVPPPISMLRDTGSNCFGYPSSAVSIKGIWQCESNTFALQYNLSTSNVWKCKIERTAGSLAVAASGKTKPSADKVSCQETDTRPVCMTVARHWVLSKHKQGNRQRCSHNPCPIVPVWPLQDRTWRHSCYLKMPFQENLERVNALHVSVILLVQKKRKVCKMIDHMSLFIRFFARGH